MTAARLRAVAPLLAAALLAPACSGKLFRPETPRVAGDADVRVNVESLHVTKFPGSDLDDQMGLRFTLEVLRAPEARIGDARLTSVRSPPCTSGLLAKDVAAISRLAYGSEMLSLAFSRPDAEAAGFLANETAVLDLAVFPADRTAPGHCLRVPLFPAESKGDWVHRGILLGGEERVMLLHSGIPNLRSPALVLGLGMGTWSGRWRWMIEGEGGFADRDDPATPPNIRSTALFALVGGAASVSTLVYTHGHFGLDVLGGYELLAGLPKGGTAGAPLPASLMLHGPRIGLRLLYLVDPVRWPGFRSAPDAFDGGLVIYAGSWWNGIDVIHPIPFLGAALEGNFAF